MQQHGKCFFLYTGIGILPSSPYVTQFILCGQPHRDPMQYLLTFYLLLLSAHTHEQKKREGNEYSSKIFQ